MRRRENSAPEKVPGQRLRLLNPRERGFGDHVRMRRRQARALERESGEFYRVAPEGLDVQIVPDARTLADPDEKAQALVARIAAVSAAIVLGFLAGEVFRSS